MLQSVRRHLAVFLAALLGVIVGSVGPGVARAAYDAVNADKVDGKHAVGAGASAQKRAGKLVAANGQGRAPDAERFKGYTHAQFRVQALPIQAAVVSGNAVKGQDGVSLAPTGTSTLNIGFVIPPDHTPNAKLHVDVIYGETGNGACTWYYSAGGLLGPSAENDTFFNSGWRALGDDDYEGEITTRVGYDGEHQIFEMPFPNRPGQVANFRLSRWGDHAADTCGFTTVYGLQLRY